MATSKGSKKPKVIQNPFSFYPLEGPEVDGPVLGGNIPFDPDGMKRAADRVFLALKVKKQDQELAETQAKIAAQEAANAKKIRSLEGGLKALKRTRLSRGRCPLWALVGTVKHKNPRIASDHGAISIRVEAILASKGKKLRDVCPSSWRKITGLPQLLAQARLLAPWKVRAKTLISQAI